MDKANPQDGACEKARGETNEEELFLCGFFVVFAEFVVSLSFTCLVVVVFASFASFVAKSFLLATRRREEDINTGDDFPL